MSELHDKLLIEKEILSRELQLLKSAMPVQKAAEKLIETMSSKTDLLTTTNENEWITNSGGNGDTCCNIM